jgi:small-conductance mechanosensitive channel
VRASHVETRDNLTVVVPNSKLVSNNVINWSHQDAKARFSITVPVPYGSDTSAIREVLLKVAKNSPYVLEYPAPFIRLVDFADSSLNIELHFWSSSFMIIEDVKSDLRLQANERLLEAGVKIPFPQRDIWIKSQPES